MKDKRSVHLKVQELADCFATTDPLEEMAALVKDADKEEAALKWLALATLHGVNRNAEKITLYKSGDGNVTAIAEYRKSELPSPGSEIGTRILEAVRHITHDEGGKVKTPLALGIRDSSIEINIKMKSKDGGEKLSLKFPDIFK